MIKVVRGNLIQLSYEGQFDVIVHGCNCFNTMGSGFALDVKKHFEPAYLADQATALGDRGKLGTYSHAFISNFGDADPFLVINAYTQYRYGRGVVHFDYDAFESILRTLSTNFNTQRFGLPRIGSGLAGGDEEQIESLIRQYLSDRDVTIVDWDGSSFAP